MEGRVRSCEVEAVDRRGPAVEVEGSVAGETAHADVARARIPLDDPSMDGDDGTRGKQQVPPEVQGAPMNRHGRPRILDSPVPIAFGEKNPLTQDEGGTARHGHAAKVGRSSGVGAFGDPCGAVAELKGANARFVELASRMQNGPATESDRGIEGGIDMDPAPFAHRQTCIPTARFGQQSGDVVRHDREARQRRGGDFRTRRRLAG